MSETLTYSLLVPCFNAENYVENFLSKITALKKPFDEVLFYDDASTDGTLDILTSKGLKVLKGEINKGPGYARNRLAQSATSDYIHFHDIDDELLPDYLTETCALAATRDFDVILCNVDWLDAATRKPGLNWHYSDTEIRNGALAYTIGHPIGGINGLYNRLFFLSTGGFSETLRIWEDADMHVNLAAHNARFRVVEKVLSISLRYPQSGSSDQKQGWINRLALLQQYAISFNEKAVRKTIGNEAQRTAGMLIMSRNYNDARRALQLSEECGVAVPSSSGTLWRLFKAFLPAIIRIELRIVQLKVAFKTQKATHLINYNNA